MGNARWPKLVFTIWKNCCTKSTSETSCSLNPSNTAPPATSMIGSQPATINVKKSAAPITIINSWKRRAPQKISFIPFIHILFDFMHLQFSPHFYSLHFPYIYIYEEILLDIYFPQNNPQTRGEISCKIFEPLGFTSKIQQPRISDWCKQCTVMVICSLNRIQIFFIFTVYTLFMKRGVNSNC